MIDLHPFVKPPDHPVPVRILPLTVGGRMQFDNQNEALLIS